MGPKKKLKKKYEEFPDEEKESFQELQIRYVKHPTQVFSVMSFDSTLNVDFGNWTEARMHREDNARVLPATVLTRPKTGAGTEYNQEAREAARARKRGILAPKSPPKPQPWVMHIKDDTEKTYKSQRVGGLNDNSSYYIFAQAVDGAIEAHPVDEWYNFQQPRHIKTFSAEQAEFEFGRRRKMMGYFSHKLRERMHVEEDKEQPDMQQNKFMKDLKKMNEESSEVGWIETDDETDGEQGEHTDSDEEVVSGGKKKSLVSAKKPYKPPKNKSDEEALEDSDDGDNEGRERDYERETSDEDTEQKIDTAMKSVAEEDAMRNLLDSDESESEDEENAADNDETEKNKRTENGADFSTDSDASSPEFDDDMTMTLMKRMSKKMRRSSHTRRADLTSRVALMTFVKEAKKQKMYPFEHYDEVKTTTTSDETKPPEATDAAAGASSGDAGGGASAEGDGASGTSSASSDAKRFKLEVKADSLPATFANVVGNKVEPETELTEPAVRRYLMRKPLTATELLGKFKHKVRNMGNEMLVQNMTKLLKRIDPFKTTIHGKLYFWLSKSNK